MKLKNILPAILVAGSIGAFSMCSTGTTNNKEVSIVKHPDLTSSSVNYNSNKAPLKPSHFIKLPLGSIKPQGWIHELLQRQSDGLCGHLGEISAWLEKKNNAWLSEGGDHGWEEVPYWLRGYSDMAIILDDKAKQDEAKIWIEGILASQKENGWFGPEARSGNGNLDYWSNMVVLFTLQNYYEYTNDSRILDFMTRYFEFELTVPDDQFLSSYWENSRGGDNLYSVYWLYNITGNKDLLKLAEKIHRNTADWTQQTSLPNWHNVNIAECFREPATWFLQSGDSADIHATYNNYDLIRRTFGQVPGGMFGSDENARMGYIDPRQGTETCGFAEQMTSDGILVGLTGDVKWADNAEDVMFNSFPAAFTEDMKSLRYITCPNGVTCDSENHHPGIDNRGPFLTMNPFSSRCCQHNHGHAIPYYIGNLVMATNDNGLATILYAANTTTAKVGDNKNVTLTQVTNYPYSDKIELSLSMEGNTKFPLYLRIPEWCNDAKVSINGKVQNVNAIAGDYFKIDREWSNNDKVELTLPMELSSRTWAVNQGSVSIDYGPLTFSLKIDEKYNKVNSAETAIGDSKWQKNADAEKWPSYTIDPVSPWNYGILLDKDNLQSSLTIEKKEWPSNNYPFSQKTNPIVIHAKGKQIPEWKIDQYGLVDVLPLQPVTSTKPTEDIELIPMGAARLRISSFPYLGKK